MAIILIVPVLSAAMTAQEVYKKSSPSVYSVHGFKDDITHTSGTGIAISDSIVATSCHIVVGAKHYRVKTPEKLIPAKLIYKDLGHDLCFLEVPKKTFIPVSFRHSSEVDVGEEVYAIGNPHGLDKSISRGIISNKHEFIDGSLLQTDATISFGSSGGGLFDTEGNLIGVTRAGHRYKDIAFAVPSEWITNVLELAQNNGDTASLSMRIAKQLKDQLSKIDVDLESIGVFGRDKIQVLRFQRHCLIAFTGKQDHDKRGILVWYPESPLHVYFVPYESVVQNALRLMVKNGFINKKSGQIIPGKLHQNKLIPDILRMSDVITKKFSKTPERQFSHSSQIYLHYPDYLQNYYEVRVRFGMLGFKKAINALRDQCALPPNPQ